MIPVHVRLYKDEDFDQVVNIAVDPLGQVRSEAERVIRWASRDDSAQIFVAEADRRVVGFLMLERPGTWWNRVAEIGWIAVLPDYQRKGIGSSLIQKMGQYAEEKDIRKLYVEPSVKNNTAIRFYVKNGYNYEATRKDWYKDGEDSTILGKHLQRKKPSALEKDILKLNFRKFKESDEKEIRRIYQQFFEDCPQLRSEEGFIVAEMNGQVVGFFVITTHETYPWWDRRIKSWCEIEELHVYHRLWRRGIGTQIVLKALEYTKAKGAEAIYVTTGESNIRARGLYEKCGFEEYEHKIRYRQVIHP